MLVWSRLALFAATPDMPRFRLENFTTANGLPDNHVFSVLVDGDRVWAATENGLALYEDGKWKVFTTADGLAHRAVLSLALDKRTGDLWVGTMGGLEPHLGRTNRHLHPTQFRAEQRRGVRRRACRATTYGRQPPPAPAARTRAPAVVPVQRAQHARCTRSGRTP